MLRINFVLFLGTLSALNIQSYVPDFLLSCHDHLSLPSQAGCVPLLPRSTDTYLNPQPLTTSGNLQAGKVSDLTMWLSFNLLICKMGAYFTGHCEDLKDYYK